MRPLAIYDDSPINRATMKDLSKKLSDWYFSETGGLMLTRHNRDLYFALQDLVSAVASVDDWSAERSDGPKARFEDLLRRRGLRAASELLEYLQEASSQEWPSEEFEKLAIGWREQIRELGRAWADLDSRERFASLQQVSSVLRTGLANDVESRLR